MTTSTNTSSQMVWCCERSNVFAIESTLPSYCGLLRPFVHGGEARASENAKTLIDALVRSLSPHSLFRFRLPRWFGSL